MHQDLVSPLHTTTVKSFSLCGLRVVSLGLALLRALRTFPVPASSQHQPWRPCLGSSGSDALPAPASLRASPPPEGKEYPKHTI